MTGSTDTVLPTIFIHCKTLPVWAPDVIGTAETEDGIVIASHISSSEDWSRHDMTSEHKRRSYEQRFPNGYRVVWASSGEELLRQEAAR